MVLNLSEVISSETVDKIATSINTLKDNENLDIYLCTPGGSVESMEAIIDIVNRYRDRINLIGYGELCSAGFYIFFSAECAKELTPGTTGMIHLVTVRPRLMGDITNWKDINDSKFLIEWTKADKKRRMDFFVEVGLNENELARVKKGEDVYLQSKRMEQLLENQVD